MDAVPLIQVVTKHADEIIRGELLRVYWYDAARDRVPTIDQRVIAQMPWVKLRLGNLNARGQQKGVDAQIRADMEALARHRAITDAVLIAGDEDMVPAVEAAQAFGVRVHLWGIEPPFGSAQALTYFAEITARGEGFGREIGQGSKRLCEKFGHPELSMTVKGQEFPAYDSRGIQGMGLAYATANRGACHLRGYTVASEILGIPVKTDPLVTDGKAELVKAFQDATAVFDSAGICVFTSFARTLADVAPQLEAACEGDWSLENLNVVGERIWNLERQFNLAAGFTAADDTLPPRLLTEPAKTGPATGKVNELHKMLRAYYEVRGWSTDGKPTPETLARLSL